MKQLACVFLACILSLSWATAFADEDEDRDFRRPTNAFEARQYQFAHRHYLIFVSKYPQSDRISDAYLRMGICSYYLEEYPRAQEELTTVIGRFPGSAGELDAKYWLGEVNLAMKNYSQAEEYFKSVLNSPFKSVYEEDASLSLAYALFRMGDPKQALGVLDKLAARTANPKKRNQFMFQRGMCLYDLAQYEDAVKLFEFLVDKSGDKDYSVRSLYWLAECYYRLNKFNSALETYFKVRRTTTDKDVIARVLYGLGWTYFKMGNFPDSQATFEELLRFAPDSGFRFSATFKIGENLYQMRKYQEATTYFAQVADSTEVSNAARFYMGECLYRLGKFEEALGWLDRVSADADQATLVLVRRNQGLCNLELSRYDRALQFFQRMYETATDDNSRASALAFTADVYFATGDSKRALQVYREVLEKFAGVSNVPKIRYYIGMSLLKQGLVDEAELVFYDTYTRYLDNEFGCLSLFQYADVQRKKGDLPAAVSSYSKFLSLPGISEKFRARARFNIAVCKYNMAQEEAGAVEQACQDFLKLAADAPDQDIRVESAFQAARCMLQLRRFSEAEKILRKIVDENPGTSIASSAQYEIAFSLYSRGNFPSAETEFARLLELFPKSEQADDAMYHLAAISFTARLAGRTRELINRLLKEYPTSEYVPRARIMLAGVTVLEGRQEEALLEYDALAKEYSTTIFAGLIALEKADLLMAMKGESDALTIYLSCVGLKVSEWAARAEWGAARALQALGRSKEALEHYLVLIFTYPNDPRREESIFEAAQIHVDQQEYDSAIKLLELAADKERAKGRIERIRKMMPK